jgi:hypothetical protein
MPGAVGSSPFSGVNRSIPVVCFTRARRLVVDAVHVAAHQRRNDQRPNDRDPDTDGYDLDQAAEKAHSIITPFGDGLVPRPQGQLLSADVTGRSPSLFFVHQTPSAGAKDTP